ncbi:hypothetical protein ACSBR1_012379 [Camellia fascicularis]
MASPCSSSTKLLLLRRLVSRALKPPSSSSSTINKSFLCSSTYLLEASKCARRPSLSPPSRSFCSRPLNLDGGEGPAIIDYHCVLQEDEFHNLADSTIHDLLEKLEEYGDSVDIDGFDIDYGNQVLTMKLGTSGTYVLNKQTPNRQIWLSSPVSRSSEGCCRSSFFLFARLRCKASMICRIRRSSPKQLVLVQSKP